MNKLSRREAIKAFASAGAFLLALPHMSRISGLRDMFPGNAENNRVGKEPLVVIVRDGELVAYEGLREFTVSDAALARELSGKLRSRMV